MCREIKHESFSVTVSLLYIEQQYDRTTSIGYNVQSAFSIVYENIGWQYLDFLSTVTVILCVSEYTLTYLPIKVEVTIWLYDTVCY